MLILTLRVPVSEFWVLFIYDPHGGTTVTFHETLSEAESLAHSAPDGWKAEMRSFDNIDRALEVIESRVGKLRKS